MSVQCTEFMNDIHKTCASHTDLKPRFVLVVHLCITCKCSVFLYNEGIVNIQVLCSIPLAWIWRYCQWYWQCLHIQTKGALITCINRCHRLELTLLCLVDLWKLDESISNFKGAWCIYFYLFLIEIHLPVCKEWKSWSYVAFLGVWSGPALFAYVHFYRTLCTSRPWSYYLTCMTRLSNVREILQFHYCNVTLYTEKRNGPARTKSSHMFCDHSAFFLFLFYI